ncbi:MAG: FkbM family methyltransferase [Flavobacteriales bacterium]|nr:FkbM family methyltransferase [Flavobacteriales bacterium]MCC6937368.1 FkbM family methyltransferase [Flavobacteriales bacterium]
MSDTIRDHFYRIRKHILFDPVNTGRRLHYLWNYLRWQTRGKYGKDRWLITFDNGLRSYVHPFPDHDAGEMNIWTRNVDFHDTQLVRKVLRKGDRIVDAGCNVGNRTWALADLIGGALMIDAGTAAIARVQENRDLNGLSANDFVTIHKAVGERPGMVRFTDEGGAYTRNMVVDADDPTSKPIVEVEMTTIDIEVARMGWRPTYLKIDVEGQDLPALKGAIGVLRSGDVRLVKFEHNASEPLAPLITFFNELGWTVFTLFKGRITQEKRHMEKEMNLFAAPPAIFAMLTGH